DLETRPPGPPRCARWLAPYGAQRQRCRDGVQATATAGPQVCEEPLRQANRPPSRTATAHAPATRPKRAQVERAAAPTPTSACERSLAGYGPRPRQPVPPPPPHTGSGSAPEIVR